MGNTTLCSHKDYLGRGVDCRTQNNTWPNSGDKLISHNKMEIEVTPIATTHQEVFHESVQSTTGGECGMGIKPHECANLFGEVTAKHYTCTKTEHREMLKTTKAMKIKRKSIKCKKYDNDLCKFIVEYIEENQEEQIDQGIPRRFTNRNPKDRLKEYLSATDKSKEVPLKMWQMVATACSLFLDKTMFTHYVSGIKLGVRQQESTNSKECGTKAACGAGVNACQGASFSAQGQYQIESERNVSTKEEIGVIDKHSNDVTKEEVIEVTLTPVLELIEHDALRVIMQALLRCHQQGSKDNQYGPFKVSCRKALSLPASEPEIYWQVINKEICGTTRVEEASTFYTKHSCTGKLFQIIYKTETKQTEMYVLPEPHDQQPLKLVPATENLQKISFKLKNKKNEPTDPPQSTASWERESPYFIQRPSTNKGVRSALPRNKCYLCVEKKEHQCDDDEQLKYTVATAKKREMDSGLMQFYFIPVTKLRDPSVSVQLRTNIESDCSEVEDDLSGQSALGGPPPPPPPAALSIQQQPECGSATSSDSPNELKDFFELVGEDYIFPIQVNAKESETQN